MKETRPKHRKERRGLKAIYKTHAKQQEMKDALVDQRRSVKTRAPPPELYHQRQKLGEQRCTMLAINNAIGMERIHTEDVQTTRATARTSVLSELAAQQLLGPEDGPWTPRLVQLFSAHCEVRSERIKLTVDRASNKALICT
jgi:hypothetical protein